MEAKLMVRLVITYAVFDVLIFVPALTLNWAEKMTLSVLTKKLKQSGHRSTANFKTLFVWSAPNLSCASIENSSEANGRRNGIKEGDPRSIRRPKT